MSFLTGTSDILHLPHVVAVPFLMGTTDMLHYPHEMSFLTGTSDMLHIPQEVSFLTDMYPSSDVNFNARNNGYNRHVGHVAVPSGGVNFNGYNRQPEVVSF